MWILKNWKSVLLLLVSVTLLTTLGFWQLDRAHQKRDLSQQMALGAEAAAIPLDQREAGDWASNQKIILTGDYLCSFTLLLDNKINRGRFGYELLQVFVTDSNHRALVNRGWIAGDPSRQTLPDVDCPTTRQVLQGQVYIPSSEAYTLEQQKIAETGTQVVSALQFDELKTALGSDIFPYEIRLDESSPTAKDIYWKATPEQADKHVSYAVQWFSLAVLAIIVFIAYHLTRHREERAN